MANPKILIFYLFMAKIPNNCFLDIFEILGSIGVRVEQQTNIRNNSFLSDWSESISRLPVATESSAMDIEQVILFLDALVFVMKNFFEKITALNFYSLVLKELIFIDGWWGHIN